MTILTAKVGLNIVRVMPAMLRGIPNIVTLEVEGPGGRMILDDVHLAELRALVELVTAFLENGDVSNRLLRRPRAERIL